MTVRVNAPSQPLWKVIAEKQETIWSRCRKGKLRERGFTTNINYTISSQNNFWNTLSIKHDDSKRWVLSLNKHTVFIMSSVVCQQRSCQLYMAVTSLQFFLFCVSVGSNHRFIVNCTPDCAWLQSNLGEWTFLQVPIILFSSDCALTDSHYFSLPLAYFKWLLNRKLYFLSVTRDHFLIMQRNCQANNLGFLNWVGGVRYCFIF